MANGLAARAKVTTLGVAALLAMGADECETPSTVVFDPSCAPPTFECNPIGCVRGGYCCRFTASANTCFETPEEAEAECFGREIHDCRQPSGCSDGFVLVSWDGGEAVCSRSCTSDADCPGSTCEPVVAGGSACAPAGDPGEGCQFPGFRCDPLGCVWGGFCWSFTPSANTCLSSYEEALAEARSTVYDCPRPDGCEPGWGLVSWDGAPAVCSKACAGDWECPDGTCEPLDGGGRACAPPDSTDPCAVAHRETVTRTESGECGPDFVPQDYFFTPSCVLGREDWYRVRGVTLNLGYSVESGAVELSVVYGGVGRFSTGTVIADGGTETVSLSGESSHLFVRVLGDPGSTYSLVGMADFDLSAP